jgi:hypothetical protein
MIANIWLWIDLGLATLWIIYRGLVRWVNHLDDKWEERYGTLPPVEPEEPIWAELRAVKKWYASDDRLWEDDDRQAAMILALEALVEARWRRHMEMEEIPVRDLVRSYQMLGVAVGSEAGSTLLDYAEREIAAGRSSMIREQTRARPALVDVTGAIGGVWLDDGTELIAYDDGRSEVRPRDPTIPTDG